jgi:hypothetical protein
MLHSPPLLLLSCDLVFLNTLRKAIAFPHCGYKYGWRCLGGAAFFFLSEVLPEELPQGHFGGSGRGIQWVGS